MGDAFDRFAAHIAAIVGSAWAFLVACLVIVVWAASGFVFGFTDTWQLVINTSTTIITFLMVFVIQTTQNREARATQVKLDELIRAVADARDTFIDIQEGTESELRQAQEESRQERASAEAPRGPDRRTAG
ncbi:MAG: low affinity iron permease family protein [Sphaerobacter sp.]|nr:low affinity iron permease family protein [Sphaerobacter sp.]